MSRVFAEGAFEYFWLMLAHAFQRPAVSTPVRAVTVPSVRATIDVFAIFEPSSLSEEPRSGHSPTTVLRNSEPGIDRLSAPENPGARRRRAG